MVALRFIDLHSHSTASDGTFSPAEVVRKAHETGLAALALTDHDTFQGLDEAEAEAKRLQNEYPERSFDFVRGCELSSLNGTVEAHILGLWISRDPDKLRTLNQRLDEVRRARDERNAAIARRFQELGYPVLLEDVAALAGGDIVGRPHFAAQLVKLGIVKDIREAFRDYLGQGGKAYVPRRLMSPEEAVSLLAESGATVSLAHPMLSHRSKEQVEDLIVRLLPCGLNAIEAYHSEHGDADVRICVDLAAKYHLLLSGGSDFHGNNKPRIRLGRGHGSLRVSAALLEKLKEDRLKRGLPL